MSALASQLLLGVVVCATVGSMCLVGFMNHNFRILLKIQIFRRNSVALVCLIITDHYLAPFFGRKKARSPWESHRLRANPETMSVVAVLHLLFGVVVCATIGQKSHLDTTPKALIMIKHIMCNAISFSLSLQIPRRGAKKKSAAIRKCSPALCFTVETVFRQIFTKKFNKQKLFIKVKVGLSKRRFL